MNDLFFRVALIGILISTAAACTAGNYDLPACGEKEICGNGIDDDCDGEKDNEKLCKCVSLGEIKQCDPRNGIVTNAVNPASICTEEFKRCRENYQWDDCNGVNPITEQCANGLDDDCDGIVDESDCVPCIDNQERDVYDPMVIYGPQSQCMPARQICKAGQWAPKTAAIGPRINDPTCDGRDDNCNGVVDENATWRSGSMDFTLGQRCWDISKVGVCRTVGTVVCSNGAASCNNVSRTAQSIYRNQASTTALSDPNNPVEVWDWNCDGKIESIFCTGSAATCTSSNISKTKFIALDTTTDCSVVKIPNCDNSVMIRSVIAGATIQCGSAIQVTECEAPFIGVNCKDKSNPQDGYTYCR